MVIVRCIYYAACQSTICCRSQLQGQMASLQSQLSQSQQTVSELQLQVAGLEAERQQLEQALQGAHAEIKTLQGSPG